MGVHIRDMQKPKSCAECPLMRGSYCAITDNFYFEEADYDPTSCPIEEVDDIAFGLYKAYIDGIKPSETPKEIVRCGECKHLKADGTCDIFADDNIRPSASDFCSYAERRE